jgi:hypothetical protein
MANTSSQVGILLITDIPQNGSDVTFTFNVKTYKALLQCDADSTSLFASATTSTSTGKWTINTVNKGPATELVEIAGKTVTFNGTNSTNLQIIEFLGATT